MAFLVAQRVKNLPPVREIEVQMVSWKDPLEKGMATHYSILAWRISKAHCFSTDDLSLAIYNVVLEKA